MAILSMVRIVDTHSVLMGRMIMLEFPLPNLMRHSLDIILFPYQSGSMEMILKGLLDMEIYSPRGIRQMVMVKTQGVSCS